MWGYIGFALAAFMLMVTLTVGSWWWALCWLFMLWLNATSVAESVQIRETLDKMSPEDVAALWNAYMKAKGESI